MPLVIAAVGIALLIAALRGTLQSNGNQQGLLDLLYSDFVGPGNFFSWIVAIGLVGAVGYYRPLRPISDAFMVLIIIVFLLAANKGGKDFFTSLESQLVNRKAPTGSGSQGSATGASGFFSGIASLSDPGLAPVSLNPIPTLGGYSQ